MYTRECSMGWCSVGGIARPDVGLPEGKNRMKRKADDEEE